MKIASVEFRNFLSYGENGAKVDFDGLDKVTLVTGPSGAGKSTIFDAIFYGLYGKPMRKISVSNLINRRVGKGLFVRLVIEKNGKLIEIERGMKPNVFRVFVDGRELDQEASKKDMQAKLDDLIGVDHVMLKHLIMLSHGGMVSFFRMSLSDRRAFIERALGIERFSEIQKLFKDERKRLEKKERELAGRIKELDGQISALLMSMESMSKDIDVEETQRQMEEIKSEGKRLVDEISDIERKREEIEAVYEDVKSRYDEIMRKIALKEAEKKRLEKGLSLDVCPTCNRPFDEHEKSEIQSELESVLSAIGKLERDAEAIECELQELKKQLASVKKEESVKNERLYGLKVQFRSLKQSLELMKGIEDKIREQKAKRDEWLSERKEIQSKVAKLQKKLSVIENMVEVFGDDGVKKLIVMQVIPVVADFMNEYLGFMNMDVHVELDDRLNEEIVVDGVEVGYESFSDGERMRIDLAAAFAWNRLLEVMHSMRVNVMLLDEITANLDQGNIEAFLQLLHEIPKKFLIITHNEYLKGAVSSRLTIEKRNGFSEMEVAA